jgi:hypothetical protein
MTSPNSSTVHQHLKTQGVRLGRNVALKFNIHGLVVLSQEVVVLLMGNCSGHVSDDVIRIHIEARVRVVTFATLQPRSSRSFILPSLVFPRSIRGMNCRSMKTMRLSKS